jgi:hypothetical protein
LSGASFQRGKELAHRRRSSPRSSRISVLLLIRVGYQEKLVGSC